METRTLVSASDPVWANDEQTLILLNATFAELPGLAGAPFAASKDDVEPHGVDIFHRAVAGEFGEIAPYSPQPPDTLVIPEPPSRHMQPLMFSDAPPPANIRTPQK
jgi:hypothetical protein